MKSRPPSIRWVIQCARERKRQASTLRYENCRKRLIGGGNDEFALRFYSAGTLDSDFKVYERLVLRRYSSARRLELFLAYETAFGSRAVALSARLQQALPAGTGASSQRRCILPLV